MGEEKGTNEETVKPEPIRAIQIREQIQESKTQAVIPRQPYEFQEEIASLIPTAGTLETTDEQESIINEAIKDLDVEIRPDGLLYLPAHKFQQRLHRAFKHRWSLIKQGRTHKEGNLILQAYFLVIEGKYITDAIGEQAYLPNNPTMSYGDAIEGAWSNALMRCCKHIGIARELWDKDYIEKWKAKYAESYKEFDKRTGEEKVKWRKKSNQTLTEKAQVKTEAIKKTLDEQKAKRTLACDTPEDAPITPADIDRQLVEEAPSKTDLLISAEQNKRFHAICSEKKIPVETCKRYLKNFYGIDSSKEIQKDWYDNIILWAESWKNLNEKVNKE